MTSEASSSIPSPTQRRAAAAAAAEEAADVWKDISLSSLNHRGTPFLPGPLFLISCSAARPATNSAVDPRKERMMKNRESASRSRARKQAYTMELEKEVEHLLQENTRLKLKYQELLMQALSAGLPVGKKRKIQRTASARF